ncbi:kinase-like domain-containing protein [Rhizophagus clarus]|uniref:Kinase-like domain-containing protein n=1 Tax=Rhizophagus clarus TaxID=94130 RepID=A0A8H3QCX6_9GLOM|nr:kinase-like domain-containing protein [Rhizophagus clarus]
MSGNAIMDQFIVEKGLKWIPYNKFKNVEYLDKGGFSVIYKATWLYTKEVVLKQIDNFDENLNEFLNEWECHEKCLDSYGIINLYGFTKNPDTSNYMAVMEYANKGNLRGCLKKVVKNNWKQKLHMLYKIISGYEKDIEDKVYVSDLGLCRPVKSFLKKDDIYGVMPFIAPEVLRDLMKKCWDENPSKRPATSEVFSIIRKWIIRPHNMKINEINKELRGNIMEFINAPIDHNNFDTESHPQACYTSRLLDFTSKKLNETLSKCLDCMLVDDMESLSIETDKD